MGDILKSEDYLREKIETALEDTNFLLEEKYHEDPFDIKELVKMFKEYGNILRDRITDTSSILYKAIEDGMKILFEGAQGAFLDIDHGTYPYVTSSNTTAGGIFTGTGVGPKHLKNIIGVAKAYNTRVGNGPFPTELGGSENPEFKAEEIECKGLSPEKIRKKYTDKNIRDMLLSGDEYKIGKAIRLIGMEYGTTTGRPRRVGYPDMVMLKKACWLNTPDSLAITKLDVLNGIDFPIAIGYHDDGSPVWDKHTYG